MQLAAPPGTHALGSSISKVAVAVLQLLLQPHLQRRLQLAAVGRLDRVCRVPEPAWWVSFSPLTASFTPWAVVCPTQPAASSLTPLNMIRSPIVGLRRRPLTPTRM